MYMKLVLLIMIIANMSFANINQMTLLDSSISGEYEYLVGKLMKGELVVLKVFSDRSSRHLTTINNFRNRIQDDLAKYKLDLKTVTSTKFEQVIVKFSKVDSSNGLLIIFKNQNQVDQEFYILLEDLEILNASEL